MEHPPSCDLIRILCFVSLNIFCTSTLWVTWLIAMPVFFLVFCLIRYSFWVFLVDEVHNLVMTRDADCVPSIFAILSLVKESGRLFFVTCCTNLFHICLRLTTFRWQRFDEIGLKPISPCFRFQILHRSKTNS